MRESTIAFLLSKGVWLVLGTKEWERDHTHARTHTHTRTNTALGEGEKKKTNRIFFIKGNLCRFTVFFSDWRFLPSSLAAHPHWGLSPSLERSAQTPQGRAVPQIWVRFLAVDGMAYTNVVRSLRFEMFLGSSSHRNIQDTQLHYAHTRLFRALHLGRRYFFFYHLLLFSLFLFLSSSHLTFILSLF